MGDLHLCHKLKTRQSEDVWGLTLAWEDFVISQFILDGCQKCKAKTQKAPFPVLSKSSIHSTRCCRTHTFQEVLGDPLNTSWIFDCSELMGPSFGCFFSVIIFSFVLFCFSSSEGYLKWVLWTSNTAVKNESLPLLLFASSWTDLD